MDYYFNEFLIDEEEIEKKASMIKEEKIGNFHQEKWILNFNEKDVERMQHDAFSYVLENIYERLSPKDLLNSSLVSKDWYNLIGKLETFTRVKLTFSPNKYDPKPPCYIHAIRESTRIYENIEITIWNIEEEIRIAEQIISKYSEFVMCLKLIKFGGYNSMLNNPLNMPKLRELEVQVAGGRLSGKFLENVTTLEKLTINGIEPKALTTCLIKNVNLKDLTVYENVCISYFKKDLSKTSKVQLKSLKVMDHNNQINLRLEGEFPAQIWSEKERMNFQKFLLTQNNLKALHLDVCNAKDLNFIFVHLSLELLEINKIIGDTSQVSCSESIKGFISKSEEMNMEELQHFLSFLPNLKSLFIYKISKHEFLKILSNKHILTKLQDFEYFWASEREYGNLIDLKKIYCGSVNISHSTREQFINNFFN